MPVENSKEAVNINKLTIGQWEIKMLITHFYQNIQWKIVNLSKVVQIE